MIPDDVTAAWGWHGAEITELPGGLINATSAIRIAGAPIAVLQRLHPAFAGEVNLDIEALTQHLADRGLATPRVIRTLDGRAWHDDHEGRAWRALTWIDGETVHGIPDASWSEAGGELVGRFHRAIADLQHDYVFARAGVHDTAAHLARLRAYLSGAPLGAPLSGAPLGAPLSGAPLGAPLSGAPLGAPLSGAPLGAPPFVDAGAEAEAVALGHQILDAAAGLPAMPDVPRRHCHGDLKISNLLFAGRPVRGVCLVDLDTIGLSTMAFELGDAMRSWCNPHKEDLGRVRFELDTFAAAIRGFRSVADRIVTADERRSIVIGLETVCVELAARFAVDLFRDEYFGWDPARFPSRRAHNLVRAHGQLALALAVRAARADALEIVQRGS